MNLYQPAHILFPRKLHYKSLLRADNGRVVESHARTGYNIAAGDGAVGDSAVIAPGNGFHLIRVVDKNENGLPVDRLADRGNVQEDNVAQLALRKIRDADARLKEIASLQKHIGNYGKTRDIYAAYRQAGYSKRFLAEHEKAIAMHKEAKRAFDALGLKKLPTIKALQQEYAALLSEKKKLYVEYHSAKQTMKDALTAKHNIDLLLQRTQAARTVEKGEPQK